LVKTERNQPSLKELPKSKSPEFYDDC
jgi:hypothetical protein